MGTGKGTQTEQMEQELRDLKIEFSKRAREVEEMRDIIEKMHEVNAARRMEELVESEVYSWWQWLFSRTKKEGPESGDRLCESICNWRH